MSDDFCIKEYQTLIFDCDGVILNSNKIKTRAFYSAALDYGDVAAEALVEYHIMNGGVSRYKKFSYFLNDIVPVLAPKVSGPDISQMLEMYASSVKVGLMTCEVSPSLNDLKRKTSEARWLVVSGGDQDELCEVFKAHDLDILFDGGIFGSPDTKDQIFLREKSRNNIFGRAVYFGDSRYDYESAVRAELDFVFVSGWSEVRFKESWCLTNNIFEISGLDVL